MNLLWAGMILAGIVYAAFHGTLPAVTEAALDSAKEAVTLGITMLGVMSFWMGLMRIAEDSGIVTGMTKRLRPVLHFLFPEIPHHHAANQYIAENMIANFLGLGWAATPAGLKAMESLATLQSERSSGHSHKDLHIKSLALNENMLQYNKKDSCASDEMCDFLILNISSLQLIPVNIIAYRSQYGSVSPTVIVGPAIIATTVSTLAAVLFIKIRKFIADRK